MIPRITISFVDYTDFYTSGEGYETKMQHIMDQHTTSYEATGSKIQQDKIMFYCWKWDYYNGEKIIKKSKQN